MSNTIGGLSIEVSADIAKLVTNLEQAQRHNTDYARRMQETMQQAADRVGETFRNLAGAVGLAFSTEKLVEFGRAAFENAEKIGKLSQSIGVTTQTLQTMSYAAGLTGSSMDVVGTAIARLEKSSVQAAAGNKQLSAVFDAIGVSVRDATGHIKPADQLIVEVTKHLSEFQNDAEKTAGVMLLMGRGAAENIPLINELGQHFEELKERARELGLVLSDEDQKALEESQRGFNDLGQGLKGLANTMAIELAPHLRSLTDDLRKAFANGQIREDVHSTIDVFAELGRIVKGVWEAFKSGVQVIVGVQVTLESFNQYVRSSFGNLTGALRTESAQIGTIAKDLLSNWGALSDDIAKMSKNQHAALAQSASDTKSFAGQVRAIWSGVTEDIGRNFGVIADATKKQSTALKDSNATTDEAVKKHLNLVDALSKESAASKKWAEDLQKLQTLQANLTSGLQGPEQAALEKYNKQIEEISKAYQDAYDAGKLTADVEQMLIDLSVLASDAYAKEKQALQEKFNLAGQLITKLHDQGDALRYLGTAQQAVNDVNKIAEEAMKTGHDLYGKAIQDSKARAEAIEKEKPALEAATKAELDHNKALEQASADIKTWAGIFNNGFDSVANSIAGFATRSIKTWKDFGKSLMDDAKQFVAQIIAEFVKLEFIRPLMASLFGAYSGAAGASGMGSLGGLFGSMSGGGGGGAGMISGLFASSGTSGSLLSPTTWIDAGKGLYNGFTSLFGGGTAAGAMSGGGSSTLLDYGQSGGGGTLFNYGAGGAVSPGMANPGFWGSGMSSYGGVLGIAGGVLAGVNEYKAAGGGLGGLAGGAAYGVGTAALAGAAGTAMSAGLTAGLASIPVVGWIALAAMFVNMISGGKLFGTAAKPIGGEFTETIGADGANLSSVMHEKGQRALFGGAYYKDKSLPIDAAAQKSADEFYAALLKGRNDFAAQFNVSMGDIIGGTFVQHFDKKGKPTTTDDTVLGVTYKNETQQQFAERLQSANYLAVLDKMGLGASKFVAALQGDADKLFAAVQDFAQTTQNIQINLGKGFQFLALGANETIVSVMKFVQGLQASGETLTQTYARLLQAQQQYNQFVAQFKPATVYVDPFEGSLAKLFDAMVAARKQANDLAIAAGASGASTEDLTNIQKAYAAQMAQLTIQLEASAQSLAFSLGLTTQGSLDQINQEIARLQGQIKPATTNVQNFGQAIQQVSQQATSAMNLLLGNLSPLNDQQKLQEALKGLQAGTVTKEQVLQIGRNLYASSEAYTQLFNMVSHMGGGGGYTPLGGGGNNAAGAAAGSSLSPSDAAKLKELLKEQATLQAAQTLGQYQTLAQQIVEIASAKGEDYMRVLEEMGIQSKDLEKGLGIKSDADLKAYLDKLQKQTDSAGQNTTSIVNAINALPSAIANAIAGKPTPVGGVLPHPAPPPTTPGGSGGGAGGSGGGTGPHGGHPPRSFSPQEFGAAVATALSPLVQQFTSAQPRSGRVAMRV